MWGCTRGRWNQGLWEWLQGPKGGFAPTWANRQGCHGSGVQAAGAVRTSQVTSCSEMVAPAPDPPRSSVLCGKLQPGRGVAEILVHSPKQIHPLRRSQASPCGEWA